jgi:hypothetical protein
MTDLYTKLRADTANAIRKAVAEMTAEFGSDKIHGFALCTDDDVMTLSPATCTKNWVAEREAGYEAIGYIYTEWDQNAGGEHFGSISKAVARMAESAADGSARDNRFESFVLALQDCRDEGLFDPETLLCCGSTDPSDHLEMLAMRAVDRLNTAAVADLFAQHLGYENYREDCG